MNKQKIIDYIELLEAKAYQSDDYFKQRNELYILNQKYKEVINKIKEKVNQYEFISGYYDDNYDGEDTTYSHDTLKEDILELLEEVNE